MRDDLRRIPVTLIRHLAHDDPPPAYRLRDHPLRPTPITNLTMPQRRAHIQNLLFTGRVPLRTFEKCSGLELRRGPAAIKTVASWVTCAVNKARSATPEVSFVNSVQRDPNPEEPETPTAEDGIEDRNGRVAAIIARAKIALRLGYIARRAVPRAVPPTGRRRAVPATRRRRALPVRRRATGSWAIVPAEPSL